MNKSELIKLVAEQTGSTQLQTKDIVNCFLSNVKEVSLQKGKVALAEFGTFKRHDSPARKGRNPLSGAEVDIPAKTTFKFKAS